ncbi:hypothetical protein QVD17_32401 [Tagetes erecta]|uniref:Uncharacterized protein n=1 Tax=Tagetes erecta TaxID=13708 RepID=A0AAD8NHY3_TARER|nr:hypothetical protein QVD17_32401 [Tagetes erecta]
MLHLEVLIVCEVNIIYIFTRRVLHKLICFHLVCNSSYVLDISICSLKKIKQGFFGDLKTEDKEVVKAALLGCLVVMMAKDFVMSLIMSSTIGKPQSLIDLAIVIESSESCVCKKSPREGSFAKDLIIFAKACDMSTNPSTGCILLNASSSLLQKGMHFLIFIQKQQEVFAAIESNSAHKPLLEVIEEIMGDHEMMMGRSYQEPREDIPDIWFWLRHWLHFNEIT